ncbi:DEAD/DEAH box helicase [Limnochorda pilosa]|uniref:DEAD/DEAH box helicase n=1 Tax=Limnochorda pilosa TaxID=1555112 RepID=UPI0018E0A73A|nr:DEAD/DEAH box helicase [Limnochorda pilosa]
MGSRRLDGLILRSPSAGGLPIPSSSLIGEPPASRAPTRILPWRVTAVLLSPGEAVRLLLACSGQRTLAPGIAVGEDLAFWAALLRVAGDLVARGRFLPDLVGEEETFAARWQPVLQGSDQERLHALARAMPAVARALSNSPAEDAVGEVLAGFVDHLVRSGLQERAADSAQERAADGAAAKRRASRAETPHELWLRALLAPDGRLAGSRDALEPLAAEVREWRRPVEELAGAPFRLCFRLEEPPAPEETGDGEPPAAAEPEQPWRLRYLLQPVPDPSLLVPMEQVWPARSRQARLLAAHGSDPRRYALTALGQAARLVPDVEAGLRQPRPAGCALDATGAYRFLTEHALALEEAGFRVMLPAWWTRGRARARLNLRGRVSGAGSGRSARNGFTLESLVRFDWQAALGDEPLTREELEQLARLKVPLVRLRGRWVQVDGAQIRQVLRFVQEHSGERRPAREVLRAGLGGAAGPGGVPVDGVQATGWIGRLLHQVQERTALEELDPPRGFQGTLRPYQMRGYAWLHFLRRWGLGACLADDMGLGKTIQTLALVQHEREAGETRPVLLVCPTTVLGNWQREASRFTPGLPVMVHHGPERQRGEAFGEAAAGSGLVLTSYALLQKDQALLKTVEWAGVVLDEAQNVKNPETKQARAARSLPAEYRVALTGTPVENHVGDLWSLMEFLNPGLLGSQADFQRRFFLPIQTRQDPEAAARLKQLTGPFILRRVKTDRSIIADLPEKLEMKVFAPLTREQATLYQAVVQEAEEALEASEGMSRRGLVLATLSKLKQVCNHPAQFLQDGSAIEGRSGKLTRLAEMLEEILETGERSLIFTQFAEMGQILRRHLQERFGREVLFLHGAVPKPQRDRMVRRFQEEDDGPPVFVLSLKAGGTGINLTRANHVFHFDRWWNPAVESQATDRAFRIGQERRVEVHAFVCAGTLEERIDRMIEQKRWVAGQVVGTSEAWLTELSNHELRELFALRVEEAVRET